MTFISAQKKGLRPIQVIFLLVLFIGPVSAQQEPSIGDHRALFDENFTWLTHAGADALVMKAKSAGFNVIVPCVWHGRGTSWPSGIAPREPKWETVWQPGHDPLLYLIAKARSENIGVHPWFTVMLRQRDFFPQFFDEGTYEKAFNPHIPGFKDFLASLILEVLSRYEIDGINLDYVRVMKDCNSEFCVQDYAEKTGRDLKADLLSKRISKAAQTAIMNWNLNAVAAIVNKISQCVKTVDPGLVLSVDSRAGDETWRQQGADSINWGNKGWVDLVYHMDYRQAINHRFIVNARSQFKNMCKLVVLIGNYDNGLARSPKEMGRLTDQLKENKLADTGIGVYSYKFLTQSQVTFFQQIFSNR